jgi:hypothetical protein
MKKRSLFLITFLIFSVLMITPQSPLSVNTAQAATPVSQPWNLYSYDYKSMFNGPLNDPTAYSLGVAGGNLIRDPTFASHNTPSIHTQNGWFVPTANPVIANNPNPEDMVICNNWSLTYDSLGLSTDSLRLKSGGSGALAGPRNLAIEQDMFISPVAPNLILQFGIQYDNYISGVRGAFGAGNWAGVKLLAWYPDGTCRGLVYYVGPTLVADAPPVYYFWVGSVQGTFHYAFGSNSRNVTADSLLKGLGVPQTVSDLELLLGPTPIPNGNTGWFDQLYMGYDQESAGGNAPWGSEFEDPRNLGANNHNAFYPTGWSGATGVQAGTCGFRPWSNVTASTAPTPYLHHYAAELRTQAVNNAYKGFYYTLGANPPQNLSFALYGNSLPNAANLIDIEIMDTTTGTCLYYEFSTGAGAQRVETAGYKQVIHTQISANEWVFRVVNWSLDYMQASAFGVFPTLGDQWRIACNITGFGVANAMTATFDAVWLGPENPPRFNAFPLSDFRVPAWDVDMTGETTAPPSMGLDYYGLWFLNTVNCTAPAMGANQNMFSQLTMYLPSGYTKRNVTLTLGQTVIFGCTGTARRSFDATAQSGQTWGNYYGLSNQVFFDSGTTYVLPGETVSWVTADSGTPQWVRISPRFTTGAASTMTYAMITVQKITVGYGEAPTQTFQFDLSYYTLDGFGLTDFQFVKTFINGTQVVFQTYYNSTHFWRNVNVTVTDYFGNVILSRVHQVNDTVSKVNDQIQLALVTMQSIDLTWCVITDVASGISKNATFYGSGQTLLYATAGGVSYRFHGMASIATNALIPAGAAFDVTATITTAQSRTVVLMTATTLAQIMAGVQAVIDKPPPIQAGGEVTKKDLEETTPRWARLVLFIVAMIAVGALFTLGYYALKPKKP